MKVYLSTNGKTGDWFDLPVKQSAINARLGSEEHEDIEVLDYELPYGIKLSGSNGQLLKALNEFAVYFEEMPKLLQKNFKEVSYIFFDDTSAFLHNWRTLKILDGVDTPEGLGEYVVEEQGIEIPENLERFINYAALGKDFTVNRMVLVVDGSTILQ